MSKDNKKLSLTPEQLRLLACLKAYIHGEKAEIAAELTDNGMLGRLFALAYIHKLVPVVCDTAIVGSPAAATEAGKALLQTAQKQAVMQTYLGDAFCTFYQKLEGRGFSPVVLKGELCRRLYEKGELRLSSDEDLFIAEDDADACAETMMSLGFTAAGGGEPEWDAGGVMTLNSADGLHIELHKRLFAGRGNADPMETVFKDAPTVTSGGGGECPIRCFEPTYALFYLICHAAKHFSSCGFGVRTVADIAAFTERHYGEIDIIKLADLSKSCGIQSFTAALYDIAKKRLGFDPKAFPLGRLDRGADGDDLLHDCLEGGLYGKSTSERAQSAKYTIGAVGGVSSARTRARAIFPPAEELKDDYPFLDKSRLLLPAAWAKRIIGYLRSGRRDAQRGASIGRARTELLKEYGLLSNHEDGA